MNTPGPERHTLQLLGELERPRGGAACRLLRLGRGRVAQQEPPAQLVMVVLVGTLVAPSAELVLITVGPCRWW